MLGQAPAIHSRSLPFRHLLVFVFSLIGNVDMFKTKDALHKTWKTKVAPGKTFGRSGWVI